MGKVSLVDGHIDEENTCLNCKHLMFSDFYGECNKQLRIVNPSDTCEHWESEVDTK